MFPKEHGAYGQLLFPMATALALGRPSVPALTLAGAAVCAFLAHEPLLILLGQRGARAARERRGAALTWGAVFTAASLGLAAFSLPHLSPASLRALAAPAICGVVLVPIIFTGREHTVGGEIVSALMLALFSAPLAMASGASPKAAWTCAAAFAAAFATATVCVHGVIAFTRRPRAIVIRTAGVLAAAASMAFLVWMVRSGPLDAAAIWAASAFCGPVAALAVRPPPARQLRVVGWTLVAGTAATSALLVALLRG